MKLGYKIAIGLLLGGSLVAMNFLLMGPFSWWLLSLSTAGFSLSNMVYKFSKRGKDKLGEKYQGDKNEGSKLGKNWGLGFIAIGILGTIASLAAAPFTGGLSMVALYAGLQAAGLGVLLYAVGHAGQTSENGVEPSTGRKLGQFFTGLLKGAAILGIGVAFAAALIAVPHLVAGSFAIAGAPFITTAIGGILSSLGSLGIPAAITATGTSLLTYAGYLFGGALVTGLIGKMGA